VTRLVVLGVFVLAVAAVADGLRGGGTAEPRAQDRAASVRLVESELHKFAAAGDRLPDRLLRNGREYLSADAIRAAFPVDVPGPIAISRIAVARDGTLALAVYRFPSARPAQGALEFWHGRRSAGGFGVPPGYFGGGLAFNRDGSLVATFSHDGQLRGIFDRTGRHVDGLPESFLTLE
jgi:hypothetical protein